MVSNNWALITLELSRHTIFSWFNLPTHPDTLRFSFVSLKVDNARVRVIRALKEANNDDDDDLVSSRIVFLVLIYSFTP